MRYERIYKGMFLDRPNRFIAHVAIDGNEETVHVKNTGRCAELLVPGATVYVQHADQQGRKTAWDLIAVEKGNRLINMDSQVPNKLVKEFLEEGNLIPGITRIRPEYMYGSSRFDLYVEAGERRIFIEVKGVTLETDGVVEFPDAPSDRAVKHVQELVGAIEEGYEAFVFFVIQMKDVEYFTPNLRTHPAFAEALIKARHAGVKIVAYDCEVATEELYIRNEVQVALEKKEIDFYSRLKVLKGMRDEMLQWYRDNKRSLPWREGKNPYHIWVSEIMLQQTRVEAVKPYYHRFLQELPTVKELAEADEDRLLKLWEGLGYYNRVRNMQTAAVQIMTEYKGEFPCRFEEIRELKGIGSYTAGAIGSIAFDLPKPAVDGNVLRVISRIIGSDEDIMKQSVRTSVERLLEDVIPKECPGDFNQSLIELGAIVCVPNGEPKCVVCPVMELCVAHREGREMELPVKKKAAARKIEKRTMLIFRDEDGTAISKRPAKGLLAGLYELPNVEGHLSQDEVIAYGRNLGLGALRVQKLSAAKHIFSHIEWHMIGYLVQVDELEKNCGPELIFAKHEEIQKRYPIPAAFEKYISYAV